MQDNRPRRRLNLWRAVWLLGAFGLAPTVQQSWAAEDWLGSALSGFLFLVCILFVCVEAE